MMLLEANIALSVPGQCIWNGLPLDMHLWSEVPHLLFTNHWKLL